MAEMLLVIGNKNYSSWSLRAWMLLKHLDLPFRELVLPLEMPEFQAKIGQYSRRRKSGRGKYSRLRARSAHSQYLEDQLRYDQEQRGTWV